MKSIAVPIQLGDAAGLTMIGITHEDELTYVLAGELVLVTNTGERPLRAGQCVEFPAGHRDESDTAQYPDVDLCRNAPAAPGAY